MDIFDPNVTVTIYGRICTMVLLCLCYIVCVVECSGVVTLTFYLCRLLILTCYGNGKKTKLL